MKTRYVVSWERVIDSSNNQQNTWSSMRTLWFFNASSVISWLLFWKLHFVQVNPVTLKNAHSSVPEEILSNDSFAKHFHKTINHFTKLFAKTAMVFVISFEISVWFGYSKPCCVHGAAPQRRPSQRQANLRYHRHLWHRHNQPRRQCCF